MDSLCQSEPRGHPVEADANYVVNTQRGTNLKNWCKFKPEHVLAALVGLRFDNVINRVECF
jgi:UDP-3-O-acyl-N-acetylglucosamine deacetylase